MKDNIKCTVAILAHNQITYIRQAIESVLEQETSYNYEILIHDDCSDDGTREVIREYEEKYPDKIVAIYEDENQYVKGNDYLQRAIWEHVRGEYYIALDGDDYWCDKTKLQSQISFLDNHSEYIAHTHTTRCINEERNTETYSPIMRENNKEWTSEDIVEWEDVFQTSSLMYRTVIQADIPREFIAFSAQDTPIDLWLCVKGRIAYSDSKMTVHRVNAIGSYTSQFFGNEGYFKDNKIARDRIEEKSRLLENFNQHTNGRYKKNIDKAIDKSWFDLLWNEGKYSEARKRQYYRNLKFKKKCFYFCEEYCPIVVKIKNTVLGGN